jgi:MinD-like ATPase involved in chromosome partitioning or flagellar assembly
MSDRPFSPTRGPLRTGAAPARSAVGRVRLMGTSRWRAPLGGRRAPRLIAVGGAAAGLGKSVVASNLAVAIAGLGPQVVLVDLDLGTPRLHELFGITRAAPGLQAWRDGQVGSLDGSLTGTGIRNLHLVTGTAVTADRPLGLDEKRELLRQIYVLDGNVVIVDVGAANRDDLLDFFSLGALRLVVSGPERPALESTFGFLKGAAWRAADRYGQGAAEVLARFRGSLIGNQAGSAEAVEAFHAFGRLVRDHLGLHLPVLGCLHGSARIAESVAARRPLLARRGLDENVRSFYGMAEHLMMDGAVAVEPEDDCDLGTLAAPPSFGPTPLPAELAAYVRKHPRYPVDWVAHLELPFGATDARVLDVSYGGVAVEITGDVSVGYRGVLRLHQLAGQPALPVVVKNVQPGLRRVGLAFLQPGEVSLRLEAAARLLAATARESNRSEIE